MPNITGVLNHHIRRLVRREINVRTRSARRLTSVHRRDLAALEKALGFLEGQERRRVAERPVPPKVEGIRFRADGLKSYRARLQLSAKDFGKLVGVAGLTIYSWESGKSKPRKAQVAKLAAVRGLGKREALKRLELMGGSDGAPGRRRRIKAWKRKRGR